MQISYIIDAKVKERIKNVTLIIAGGNIMYLITDGDDKTLKNVLWTENCTNEQFENPNYLFSVYDDPILALMMNAAYEGFKNPHIWKVEGEKTLSFGFRYECKKLKAIKRIEITEPTSIQRIAFSILCSIHLMKNQFYKIWAKNYLNGNNRTKETADCVMQQLQNIEMNKAKDQQEEYVSCGIASIMAVLVDSWQFSANAAHRAYYDSPEKDRIDLIKLANIAFTLSPEEISQVI